MRAFVLVALLCLSVACEEDRPRALGAPYDAGPGGAQATTSRCPTFTGFDRVGRSWHSSTTDEYEAEYRATVSQMSEVVALEDLGDHVDVSVAFEVSISGVLPQGPFIIYTQGSLLYRCSAAGLTLVEEQSNALFALPEGGSTEVDDKLYEPGLLILPAELIPGVTSAGAADLTHAVDVDGESTMESFEVLTEISTSGQVSVTTPAGTFDAWAVTTTENGETSTTYWAEGVGRVADDAMELVAYE